MRPILYSKLFNALVSTEKFNYKTAVGLQQHKKTCAEIIYTQFGFSLASNFHWLQNLKRLGKIFIVKFTVAVAKHHRKHTNTKSDMGSKNFLSFFLRCQTSKIYHITGDECPSPRHCLATVLLRWFEATGSYLFVNCQLFETKKKEWSFLLHHLLIARSQLSGVCCTHANKYKTLESMKVWFRLPALKQLLWGTWNMNKYESSWMMSYFSVCLHLHERGCPLCVIQYVKQLSDHFNKVQKLKDFGKYNSVCDQF